MAPLETEALERALVVAVATCSTPLMPTCQQVRQPSRLAVVARARMMGKDRGSAGFSSLPLVGEERMEITRRVVAGDLAAAVPVSRVAALGPLLALI